MQSNLEFSLLIFSQSLTDSRLLRYRDLWCSPSNSTPTGSNLYDFSCFCTVALLHYCFYWQHSIFLWISLSPLLSTFRLCSNVFTLFFMQTYSSNYLNFRDIFRCGKKPWDSRRNKSQKQQQKCTVYQEHASQTKLNYVWNAFVVSSFSVQPLECTNLCTSFGYGQWSYVTKRAKELEISCNKHGKILDLLLGQRQQPKQHDIKWKCANLIWMFRQLPCTSCKLYLWAWAFGMANYDCLLKHLIYLRSFKCASNSTKTEFNYSSLKNGCKTVTMNVVTCIQFSVCNTHGTRRLPSTAPHKRFTFPNLQEESESNFLPKIIHSTRGISEADLIRYKLVIFAIVLHTQTHTWSSNENNFAISTVKILRWRGAIESVRLTK